MKDYIFEVWRNRYEDMIDHRNKAVVKLKPKSYSGLRGFQAPDLCDTAAVLYQLSYQVNWWVVTLKARNIPVDGEKCSWVRMPFRQDH